MTLQEVTTKLRAYRERHRCWAALVLFADGSGEIRHPYRGKDQPPLATFGDEAELLAELAK